MKKFGKFMLKNVFTKKNFEKAKSRRGKRRCYECHKDDHLIADCPKLSGKQDKRVKPYERDKPIKKERGQAYVSQQYVSNAEKEYGAIANLAYGLAPAKVSLFNNLINDKDGSVDARRCFMAEENKVASQAHNKNDIDDDEDLVPSISHELTVDFSFL